MGEVESVDLRVVTEAHRNVWSEGDFARLGSTTARVAEQLCVGEWVRAGDGAVEVPCEHRNVALGPGGSFAAASA